MLCKRCMTVMRGGTIYEQGGHDRSFHKRYFECKKCHDRVYTNAPNFQECLDNASSRNRNK